MNTIHFKWHHLHRLGFVIIIAFTVLLIVYHKYERDRAKELDMSELRRKLKSELNRGNPVIGNNKNLTDRAVRNKHLDSNRNQGSLLTFLAKLKLPIEPKVPKKVRNKAKTNAPQHEGVIASLNDLPDDFVQDPATFTSLSSLKFSNTGQFLLLGHPLTIIGGSMHYFRVAEGHWRDRLVKMRAAGINTLDTVIPWNLHEGTRGTFNFNENLNLRKFIQLAHEIGLYVVIKPGPFVGADLDFGGLPSWFLSDPNMEVRSNYKGFTHSVGGYIKRLSEEIEDLQFKNGGPVIAIQVEDEFGDFVKDKKYLKWLRNTFIQNGLTELLFTADKHSGLTQGTIPGVLATAKFSSASQGVPIFNALEKRQSGAPKWVSAVNTGSVSYWGQEHKAKHEKDIAEILDYLMTARSSVTLYMFVGGTNFGFMNGANTTSDDNSIPCATTYDFDAPISETGHLTSKYFTIKSIIQKYYPEYIVDITVPITSLTSYDEITLTQFMSFENILSFTVPDYSNDMLSMEMLSGINDGNGQGYGFVLYRKNGYVTGKELRITRKVRDIAQIMINSQVSGSIWWNSTTKIFNFPDIERMNLDILVENLGRTSSGKLDLNNQNKGIPGTVIVDGEGLRDWVIYSLEFDKKFMKRMTDAASKWEDIYEFGENDLTGPLALKGKFQIKTEPRDTYLNMKDWTKGIVFINGHNLGRYWQAGPQRHLYIPAPWLKKGINTIIIFELKQGTTIIQTTNTTVTDEEDEKEL